jgi:hypothetical protein
VTNASPEPAVATRHDSNRALKVHECAPPTQCTPCRSFGPSSLHVLSWSLPSRAALNGNNGSPNAQATSFQAFASHQARHLAYPQLIDSDRLNALKDARH